MRRLTFAMILMLTLAPLACVKKSNQTPTTAQPEEKTMAQSTPTPAPTPAGDKLHPQILLQTSAGDITLVLDGEKAPISTLNFVQYVKDGFLNGTIFHRTMPGFMIQGGGNNADFSPKTQGLRPGIKNEWRNGLKNERGTISMARGGDPDSGTSQFFINVNNNDFLDQPRDGAAYAVFGKVTKGMDVVDKIVAAPATYNEMGEKAKPLNPIVVKEAKLIGDFDQAAVEKLAQQPQQQ